MLGVARRKPFAKCPPSCDAAAVTDDIDAACRRALGFLADARRFNVAVTRGRRHVALVCDADTLAADPFLGRLVAHFSERGVHESAQTLLDEVDG